MTQSSNTSYDLTGVYFLDANSGWVVGRDGIILHTTNSGVDWSSRDSGVDENLNSVCFISSEEGWIAGENGLVLHTYDGGITWQPEGSGTMKQLRKISYVEGNGLVAIGADCTIIKRVIKELYP